MVEPATLYIVATPIGNLEDITLRAIQVLKSVTVIAAEDTRHSQRLLQHYQVDTPLLSLHDHNEKQRAERLVERLQSGQAVALISDAGTPLISDPGYALVSRCRAAGIRVVPIPGPCAAVAALCAAGLPTDRFRFEGFLPVKEMARRASLANLKTETSTVVFYEAPRRVRQTLVWLCEELGAGRSVVLAKELTKTFETIIAGSASEVLAWLDADEVHQKGEFVLMVGPADVSSNEIPPQALSLLARLATELPLKKAAAITAEQYGLKKNTLYQLGLNMGSDGAFS